MQLEVGVAKPGVQLDGQPTVDARPQQVAQQDGVVDPRRPGALDVRKPPARRLDHVRRGRALGVEVEAVPVGDDRLHPDGVDRPLGEALDVPVGELLRGHAVERPLLGDALQPHHFVGGGARDGGQHVGVEELVASISGIDEIVRDAAGSQQSTVHLIRPELVAPGDVRLRRRMRIQVEQRCAPTPEREPDLGVQLAGAGRSRPR